MNRLTIIVRSDYDRKRAATWSRGAPTGTRIVFMEPKRTIPQNDKMWAALTDVSEQLVWQGVKLSTEDWKIMFLDALSQELRVVPSLDGKRFVPLGRSSSNLSKVEMIDMIELIHAFGAQHGVVFHEPEDEVA